MQDAAPRHRHLTPQMRDALRRARHEPLRRVRKPGLGQPPWPAPASSLAALVRRELVVRTEETSRKGHPMTVWTITDRGIRALDHVRTRPDRVCTLRIAGGSTRLMQLGVWVDVRMPEPEAMRLAA